MLILQFVVKNAIEKKAEGAPIEADFQFAYWAALIAMGIAGFISYLRMQKTHNIVVSVSQTSTTTPTTENISQPQITSSAIPQTSNFDIGEWVKKNKRQVTFGTVGIFAIFILLLVLNKTIWSVEHKAQKLIDSGLYEQARMILDNEIQKNPDNENLYFFYGKYYLAKDDFSNATQSFEQAALINSGIRSKIADAYFNEAEKSMKVNNVDRANNFFSLCVKYNPNEKDKAVKELVNAIEENLKQNNTGAAHSYTQTAINFDPNSSITITEKAFDIAKSLASSSQNANNIIAIGEFSNTYNNSLQNEWGSLLKSFLDNNSKSIDKFALANFCQRAAQWNVSLKSEMSSLVLQQAKEEIKKSEFDVNAIQSLLNSATAINDGLRAEASTLIWNKLSTSLADLKTLGQSRFLSLYNLCENYGLNSKIQNSDNYQLSFALKNYLDGSKETAFSIFSNLSQNPNSITGKISSQILAPPKVGTINFNSSPFLFKGTWSYFNGNGLNITLKSAKITNSTIVLTFNMKNDGSSKECFIYAPKNINERWGSNCEKLYILDNNGKKFYSYNGLSGGKHEEFNSCTQKICFNPGEEIILSSEFPMVSAGASSINFVSPDPDNAGHQSEWSWDNIKIKDGPFDK